MIDVSSTALADAILRFRFKGSLKLLDIAHVNLGLGDWNILFEHIGLYKSPYLEYITVCMLAARARPDATVGRGPVFFYPLRMRQETLRRCGCTLEFTLGGNGGKVRVDGVQLALTALGEQSSYAKDRCNRPSPGCPDMRRYAGDRVGRLVTKAVRISNTEKGM